MAVYGFLFMLMVTQSLALWNPHFEPRNWAPSRARAVECTGNGLVCGSCTEAFFCTGAGATPISQPCDPTEVCVESGPLQAACSAYTGVTAGDCDCDTIGNSGFLADPFDSSKYILCVPPEQQFFTSCPAGEEFSQADNGCVVPVTTAGPTTTGPTTTPAVTTTPQESTEDPSSPGGIDQVDSSTDTAFCGDNGIGLFTDDPTCQTYTACFSDQLPGMLLECNAGEVFDSTALRCVPECDLAPSAFTCPSNNANGAFPDTIDCTIFWVCSNGLLVTPDGISCPDGQLFEPDSMTCIAESPDAVCPEIDGCWAAYCDSCGGTCPASTATTVDSGSGGNSDDSTADPTDSTSDSNGGSSGDSTGDTTAATSTTTTTTPIITSTTTELTSTPTTTSSTTTTTTKDTTTTPEPTPTTTPLTTTGGPPSCGGAPGVYEDTSDCSQFYQCEADDAGLYEAILFSCPSPLVFVPSLGYCFLQSSLPEAPGCIAS